MKKILLFLLLFAGISFPQTYMWGTLTGKTVEYLLPISLSKATTNYSGEIYLDGYLPFDSTTIGLLQWQSDDTCTFTVTLETKSITTTNQSLDGYVSPGGTLTAGQQGGWRLAATFVTNQVNLGNDSLYSYSIMPRGSVASGVTDMVSMAGKWGNKARIKVVFTNPTTVGNSGNLRMYLFLRKRY